MAFWKGKKVFLTGHTGFKGSWLSLWLQTLRADVVGFSLDPPTIPSLFEIANIEKGMISIKGDIGDFKFLKTVLQKYQPEIVIHMAAQSLVGISYKNPLKTYETNVIGTANVLEAIRQTNSVKVIINITSDKCYKNQELSRGYRETDTLGGYDPYSSSKACSELMTQAYYSSYFRQRGVGLASARAGNVIGGGDWSSDRLIPSVINACIKQHDMLLRYPHAIRPWQYVLEPLSGYLLLARHLYESASDYSSSWNFGPRANKKNSKPVNWIVNYIMKQWGCSLSWTKAKQQHYETSVLYLDSTKANSILGWKVQWDLERGLNETIDWYRSYFQGENMQEKTLKQIIQFSESQFL